MFCDSDTFFAIAMRYSTIEGIPSTRERHPKAEVSHAFHDTNRYQEDLIYLMIRKQMIAKVPESHSKDREQPNSRRCTGYTELSILPFLNV